MDGPMRKKNSADSLIVRIYGSRNQWVEMGLVAFIIILSDPLVKFLLRAIYPDHYEELRFLLCNGGGRAEGMCIGSRDSVGHLLVILHAYKYELQQP